MLCLKDVRNHAKWLHFLGHPVQLHPMEAFFSFSLGWGRLHKQPGTEATSRDNMHIKMKYNLDKSKKVKIHWKRTSHYFWQLSAHRLFMNNKDYTKSYKNITHGHCIISYSGLMYRVIWRKWLYVCRCVWRDAGSDAAALHAWWTRLYQRFQHLWNPSSSGLTGPWWTATEQPADSWGEATHYTAGLACEGDEEPPWITWHSDMSTSDSVNCVAIRTHCRWLAFTVNINPIDNDRWWILISFSSRRPSYLEQSTAAPSLAIFRSRLKTPLFRRCFPWLHRSLVVPKKWHVITDTLIVFITYLLTYNRVIAPTQHLSHCQTYWDQIERCACPCKWRLVENECSRRISYRWSEFVQLLEVLENHGFQNIYFQTLKTLEN